MADRAVFFAPAAGGDAAVARLRALDVPGRGWREKVRVGYPVTYIVNYGNYGWYDSLGVPLW